MRYVRRLHVQSRGLRYLKCAMLALVALAASATCSAQDAQTNATPGASAIEDMSKNPALVAEFGKLAGRLQQEVTLPAPREESPLLPVLPVSTTFYIALPNYGAAAHQALGIFQQELQASPALRAWWRQIEPPSRGMKLEDSVEKFYQLSQYLGDEVVVSGATGEHELKVLIVAQIRKPGFKEAFQQILRELPADQNLSVRVLDKQELATVNVPSTKTKQFLVLVRPDLLVASGDLGTLRSFSARLDSGNHNFVSTPFGERVAATYKGGATMVGAADLHTMIGQIPHGTPQSQLLFQRSGFADADYLVWKQKHAEGISRSDGELSFTGPRHGIASWLAAPGPMGGLNFASPRAVVVTSMRLKNPPDIFDDIWEFASTANPAACSAISAYEQMLGVNLRDDLLAKLNGELTIELSSIAPKPAWTVIVGVKDAAGLQQTLNKLFVASHIVTGQAEENGITFYTIPVPSGKTATEITYAYAPGYLILSSSHETIQDAIQLHRSGGSLGKSAKFLASLPPGHPSGASALMYQDPAAMAMLQLQSFSPGSAGSLANLVGQGKPTVASVYGEETAIRSVSTNQGVDAGAILVVAAVAIPNLLRSKMAANDASAVASMRSIVTAETAYASTYPYRRYAPDLATLGRNPNGPSYTADHAALLDATIANPSCTAGAWCTKAGYRFIIVGTCAGQVCSDFVVAGTPVAANTGTKSFCATSDGVIHEKTGDPVTTPVSASECRAWPPFQ